MRLRANSGQRGCTGQPPSVDSQLRRQARSPFGRAQHKPCRHSLVTVCASSDDDKVRSAARMRICRAHARSDTFYKQNLRSDRCCQRFKSSSAAASRAILYHDCLRTTISWTPCQQLKQNQIEFEVQPNVRSQVSQRAARRARPASLRQSPTTQRPAARRAQVYKSRGR